MGGTSGRARSSAPGRAPAICSPPGATRSARTSARSAWLRPTSRDEVRILNENGSRLLEGVVSVVSGGGGGIGQAVVTRFAEHGAVVELVDINSAAVPDTARALRTP